MAKYQIWSEYCKESGYPAKAMDRLLHSHLADKISFRPTGGRTAPFYVRVEVFESLEKAGEFKDILEG